MKDKHPFAEEDVLLCPGCGEGYLHHWMVEVGFRDEEDGPGTLTTVGVPHPHQRGLSKVEVVRRSSDDFPGRRDYAALAFWCEHCSANTVYVLRLMQHKGRTLLKWTTHHISELAQC